MILSHRPHGSGHPYRYDLDQRVPPVPLAGERFEIRVQAETTVTHVRVEFDDGRVVQAGIVEPHDMIRDHGPQPAARTADGHLAAAAESAGDTTGTQVWVAAAASTHRQHYWIVATTPDGEEVELGDHEIDPACWQNDAGTLTVTGNPDRVDTQSVQWLVNTKGPIRVRFKLRLDPGQHVTGLGERYESVDHRGEQLDCVVFEQYKHQGSRTYLPAPMAVVVGGDHWGFHIDTSRRTWFDIGATDPNSIIVEAETDPDNPTLELGLWDGPPAAIIKEFLDRTGRPKPAPSWVFEPWMSSNEWNTQQRVEQETSRTISENIPAGVVVIEAWSDESTFTAFRDATYDTNPNGEPHTLDDFAFDPDGAWPDPAAMIKRLHDQGIRVLLWQIPLIPTDPATNNSQTEADLKALQRLGYCVREADGSAYTNRSWWFPGAMIPDFTNPAARQWWGAKRRYLLDELGIDGFKTDGGEHLWGHDLQFSDGTRGAETNNRFPNLYAQTYHELMADTGIDGITFSRSGFAGASAVPCHWAGDEDSTWEGFRASIRAGLNAALVGVIYWGWDLAGFSGEAPDAELYLRSAAMATFCPIMQYHSEYNHHRQPSNDRTPWNIAQRTGDPAVIDTYRNFAQLRHRLVPYLHEQANKAVLNARPLMRPLFIDHPDDPETWSVPLQYQLGDDLLVAPITQPDQTEIRVYLPEGQWIDCHNRQEHTGPAWITRTVPLHEIAVYKHADASRLLDNVFHPPQPAQPGRK